MESGVKIIAGGLALFVLGGLSVYLITRPDSATVPTAAPAPITFPPPSESATNTATPVSAPDATTSMDAASFYEAANARREQQLIDKAEADRLAKLKAIKERSVECTFWKQQQKTSSAAAKIDEKINAHCNLPSSASASSAASDSASAISSSISSTPAAASP